MNNRTYAECDNSAFQRVHLYQSHLTVLPVTTTTSTHCLLSENMQKHSLQLFLQYVTEMTNNYSYLQVGLYRIVDFIIRPNKNNWYYSAEYE